MFRSALACVASFSTLGLIGCGGGASPTAPSGAGTGGSDVLALEVSCPTSLLIGQRGPCIAVARLRSGEAPLVSFEASWSSDRPEIVEVDNLGVVKGRSAGQALLSAQYRDRKGTTTVAVVVDDALRVDSGQADQGDFRPGSTVTMWLQGYYSVASAEAGRLSLRIQRPDWYDNHHAPNDCCEGRRLLPAVEHVRDSARQCGSLQNSDSRGRFCDYHRAESRRVVAQVPACSQRSELTRRWSRRALCPVRSCRRGARLRRRSLGVEKKPFGGACVGTQDQTHRSQRRESYRCHCERGATE